MVEFDRELTQQFLRGTLDDMKLFNQYEVAGKVCRRAPRTTHTFCRWVGGMPAVLPRPDQALDSPPRHGAEGCRSLRDISERQPTISREHAESGDAPNAEWKDGF